jgi:large subunit ribosomal protein L13
LLDQKPKDEYPKATHMIHTIDATEKSLGRVAGEAAKILMGKHSPQYQRNKVLGHKVEITNASKAKISQKKLDTKEYESYSGYPGGLKFQTMKNLVAKKGYAESFKLAVYGMLPANRLRNEMMKNLKVTE